MVPIRKLGSLERFKGIAKERLDFKNRLPFIHRYTLILYDIPGAGSLRSWGEVRGSFICKLRNEDILCYIGLVEVCKPGEV
jgi:hypothetical protein